MYLAILLSTIRILTFDNSGIKPEQKKEYLKTTSFVLNSISRERKIVIPKLDENNIVFDLKHYGIDPEIYDSIYKSPVRVDQFINFTLTDNYYKLLKINNLADYRKLVCAQNNNLQQSGVYWNSMVARYGRLCYREPTLTGSLWTEYDINMSNGGGDIIAKILHPLCDQKSYIANLPNGLLVYYAEDQNKRINKLDVKNFIDQKLSNKIVRVPISCMACHDKGIQEFDDGIRQLMKNIDIKTAHEENAKKLQDLFGSPLPFKEDQNRYRKAIKNANGLKPEQNSALLIKIVNVYNEPLSKEKARMELGMNKKLFDRMLKQSNNPRILQWYANDGLISREIWEKYLREEYK